MRLRERGGTSNYRAHYRNARAPRNPSAILGAAMRMLTTLAALATALPAAAQTITITTPERTHTASAVEIKELMGELVVELESGGRKTSLKCMDVVDMSLAPMAVTRAWAAADVQIVLWTGDSVF